MTDRGVKVGFGLFVSQTASPDVTPCVMTERARNPQDNPVGNTTRFSAELVSAQIKMKSNEIRKKTFGLKWKRRSWSGYKWVHSDPVLLKMYSNCFTQLRLCFGTVRTHIFCFCCVAGINSFQSQGVPKVFSTFTPVTYKLHSPGVFSSVRGSTCLSTLASLALCTAPEPGGYGEPDLSICPSRTFRPFASLPEGSWCSSKSASSVLQSSV